MSAADARTPPPATRWELPSPAQNHLLASLPATEFEVVAGRLESVALAGGDELHGPDSPASHAWFPSTAVVSLQQVIDGRPGSEVALVGREGIIGLAAVLGNLASSRRASVQWAGQAWRMPAQSLSECFDTLPTLRAVLLRQAQNLMAQIAQNGVCYRLHSVEQQLCRRLLTSMDRLASREIALTHEALARALGVRREAVTLAACRLLSDGLVRGGRGRIIVLDRDGLQARACECYSSLRAETERLMGAPPEQAR